MANKCHMCLLAQIIFCLLLTGTNGVEEMHEFGSSGENVCLPCSSSPALSDCTSTTWDFNSYSHSDAVELIAEGNLRTDRKRHERLSLGSDCSLNIKKVSEEDCGSYSCKKYVDGKQHGTDAHVYLHVLQVFSSSVIRPGRSVTLSCQLYYYGVSCNDLVQKKEVQLKWVNQAGVNLMTDSRYKISFSSSHCVINLTTTLLKEDHNREWICQLTQKNQSKTSVTYTIKYSGFSPLVIAIPAVLAALAVVVVVAVLICKKRVDNKRATDGAVVKDVNDHKDTYEKSNLSIPSAPNTNERTKDVTYTEVTSSSKKPVKMENDHSYDTVTYAAIRETESVLQEGLYASVKK